jgi:DNA polymerase-3 subunit gamma/tau
MVAVVGWGEWPDPAGCLSDPLPSLEKAWAMPPAQRPTGHRPRPAAAAVAAPPAPPRPRPPRPAPPAAPRHRIASWRAWGLLPEGLSPSSIAAAYVRVTGCPAPRDPARKQSRAYSPAELGLALAELGYPPPPDPLPPIWAAALDRLASTPSSRMLLSQQARLLRLDDRRAVVGIAAPWVAMVQSRLPLLEQALAAVIGSPRLVVLELLEVAR